MVVLLVSIGLPESTHGRTTTPQLGRFSNKLSYLTFKKKQKRAYNFCFNLQKEKTLEICQGFAISSDGSTFVLNLWNGDVVKIKPSDGNTISEASYSLPLGYTSRDYKAGAITMGPDDEMYAVIADVVKGSTPSYFAKLNEAKGIWEIIGRARELQVYNSQGIFSMVRARGLCFGPPNEEVVYFTGPDFNWGICAL